MTLNIFDGFDFSLLDDPSFKEDSVREEIISKLLYELGYTAHGLNRIIRSKSLKHPFVMVGSSERKITIIPDYLLSVDNKPVWVLDAKAPHETITSGKHVQQVYFYAIHPEIRTPYYALCNGHEFVVFKVDQDIPCFHVHLSEIKKKWHDLYKLLSPSAFIIPKTQDITPPQPQDAFDYMAVKPLLEIKTLKKQSEHRHFGVHPYFTRQVWNVVQDYIKNFTQSKDLVLDPFGGSGVTAIEALMCGRSAIHLDLNPLSVFIVKSLIQPISLDQFASAYQQIVADFERHAPRTEDQIQMALATYPYPKGIPLPQTADVETIEQLFSPKQLAQLAYLKTLIRKVADPAIRDTLLLMFSGLLNKINLMFHPSKNRTAGRGNSAIFQYYRYRIAPNPTDLDLMRYFQLRYRSVLAAKQELAPFITAETIQQAQVVKGTATDLSFVASDSVDYIYTDPPYGKKIQYLDLSLMFNAWLDLSVTPDDYEQEAIEGGERKKRKDDYADLLSQSIEEMYRVLKFNRWMSFVFAHQDPSYWHLIIEAAEKAGFEYVGSVSQGNDKTSFKKRQNPYTVLSGQLIINFKKVHNPRAIMKMEIGGDITALIIETIEGVIAQKTGATLEEINDELIMKGIEFGFLDVLSKKYSDITPLLSQYFAYDTATKKYFIPLNTKFKSRIDVEMRIRYFLISYLKRMKQQGYNPTFDEIILHIMPLLKNGITPEDQTIRSVLEEIAVRTGKEDEGRWELREGQQLKLL